MAPTRHCSEEAEEVVHPAQADMKAQVQRQGDQQDPRCGLPDEFPVQEEQPHRIRRVAQEKHEQEEHRGRGRVQVDRTSLLVLPEQRGDDVDDPGEVPHVDETPDAEGVAGRGHRRRVLGRQLSNGVVEPS